MIDAILNVLLVLTFAVVFIVGIGLTFLFCCGVRLLLDWAREQSRTTERATSEAPVVTSAGRFGGPLF